MTASPEEAIEEMKLQPEIMRDLITKYDVISVRERRYPRIKTEGKTMDVYHEYGMVPFQHRRDLDITLQILKEKISGICTDSRFLYAVRNRS